MTCALDSFIAASLAFSKGEEVKLDAARMVKFIDLIFDNRKKLKGKLGDWISNRWLRLLMVSYGQDIKISEYDLCSSRPFVRKKLM